MESVIEECKHLFEIIRGKNNVIFDQCKDLDMTHKLWEGFNFTRFKDKDTNLVMQFGSLLTSREIWKEFGDEVCQNAAQYYKDFPLTWNLRIMLALDDNKMFDFDPDNALRENFELIQSLHGTDIFVKFIAEHLLLLDVWYYYSANLTDRIETFINK